VSVLEYASSTLIIQHSFFDGSVDISLIQTRLPHSELKAETRRLRNISKSPILELSDDMGSLPLQSASLQVKRIAIIGAGPSGLAVAKYLLAEKFDKIDIYEQQYAFPYFTCFDNILLCLIENKRTDLNPGLRLVECGTTIPTSQMPYLCPKLHLMFLPMDRSGLQEQKPLFFRIQCTTASSQTYQNSSCSTRIKRSFLNRCSSQRERTFKIILSDIPKA
jgi:hypothetical protein